MTQKLRVIITIVLSILNLNAGLKSSDTILVTAKQIENMKVHSMIDLLNQLPSVKASGTRVEFNGFDTKDILVLLNGRAINDPTSSWRAVDWSSISVSGIEKLEIIKGSTGGKYGSHSDGGIVKIKTKQADKKLKANLKLAIGSHKYKNIEVGMRKRVGKYGINLSVKGNKADGFRANSSRKSHSLAIRFQRYRDANEPILLSLNYSHLDRYSPGPIHNLSPLAYSWRENFGTSLIVPFKRIKSQTYFNSFERFYRNPDKNFTKNLKEWEIKQSLFYTFTSKNFGEFDFSTDAVFRQISGLNIQKHNEKSSSIYIGKSTAIDNFLSIKTPLKIKYGIKSNFYSNFSNTFNKNIKLTYIKDNISTNLSLASFNKLPSATKRYYSSTTLQANPNLKMEKGNNYKLRASYEVSKSLSLSSSLFYNKIKNKINYTREGNIGTYKNIGSTTTKGVQTSIKYKVSEKFRVSLGYTNISEKDDKTGNYLSYSPKHVLVFNANVKPDKNLLISTNTTYKSKRYYNASNTGLLEGRYFRSNIRMDYSFMRKSSIYLKVDNVFNAKFHGTAGYPVAPRSLFVGINYSFR